MIAQRIEQAVAEFNHRNKPMSRYRYVSNTFPKSKRKSSLLKALKQRNYILSNELFIELSQKYDVRIEKLNQVINGNYSLKIKNND
jgi:ribosomal protein S8